MKLLDKLFNRKTPAEPPNKKSFFYFGQKHAGIQVNHENALTYSAIWRCVNLISQSIGALPWQVFEREYDSDGRQNRRRLMTHPAATVLNLTVNDELSSQHFRESILAHALTWGNGYAEIERDKANRPLALWLIEPDRVIPFRENGILYYRIKNGHGIETILEKNDMFHLRGLGFDGLVGYSVITMASKTISLGMATENFGGDFFQNGAHIGGVFEHPSQLGDKAIEHLKESIHANQNGKNKLSPMILEEGMKYTPTSIPPNDAQFLETRKFNIGEVARWYGVPLHKLHEMDKSSFNNIEHQSIEYVQDALVPWVKRLENEANIKLVSKNSRNRIYTKMNLNSLLRGDMKTRQEYYKTMSNLGVYSINDILELEDRNPIGADGDKRLVQLNLTTLEKVGEDVEIKTELPTAPDDTQSEPDQDTESEPDQQAKIARKIMVKNLKRCFIRENHRIDDALKRYDDREGVIEWMNNFYNQHSQYMNDQLILPAQSCGIDTDLDIFIDNHIKASRLEILTAFDNNQDYKLDLEPEKIINKLYEAIT